MHWFKFLYFVHFCVFISLFSTFMIIFTSCFLFFIRQYVPLWWWSQQLLSKIRNRKPRYKLLDVLLINIMQMYWFHFVHNIKIGQWAPCYLNNKRFYSKYFCLHRLGFLILMLTASMESKITLLRRLFKDFYSVPLVNSIWFPLMLYGTEPGGIVRWMLPPLLCPLLMMSAFLSLPGSTLEDSRIRLLRLFIVFAE